MLAQNVSDTEPGLELDSAGHEEYIVPLDLKCPALIEAKMRKCFVVAPSSGGGNSSLLHDSQGGDELATLDRYYHLHGHSGLCA